MTTMASQITSFTVVYSIVYSGVDQRKHQRSASLAFVREFTGTGEFPAQRASNAENVPFDDVIMTYELRRHNHNMETLSASLALCERNTPVPGCCHHRPVIRSLDVFVAVGLFKLLNKEPKCRWFRGDIILMQCHCNETSLSACKGNQLLVAQWCNMAT